MIKAVIFDIDNTLYDYDKNHVYGMKALADYCESAFGKSEEEMRKCYKEAQKVMLAESEQIQLRFTIACFELRLCWNFGKSHYFHMP